MTVILSAIAMALITAAVANGMFTSMRASVLEELDDRITVARGYVAQGNFTAATDNAGSVLVVVLDADGNVVASSSDSAMDIDYKTLLTDKDDDFEIDDLLPMRERDDDDDDDGDDALESDDADDDRDDDRDDDADDPDEAAVATTVTAPADSATPQRQAQQTQSASADDDADDDYDEPDHDEPAYDEPDYDEPDYDEPDHDEPAYDEPDYDEPDYDEPDYDEPDYDDEPASNYSAPSYSYDEPDDDYDYDEPDYDDDSDDDDDDDDDHGAHIIGPPFMKAARFPLALASPADTSSSANDREALLSAITGKPGPFLVSQRKASSGGQEYTIIAIASLASALDAARQAALGLAGIFLLLLVAIGWFTWSMSGATLAPVEQMRGAAEEIMADNLSSRLPVPEHDPDLAPLATTFNEVIARMESDLDAQRRFISDASHELKSPVAASAIILETIAADPDSVKSDEVIGDLIRENSRMQGIVSDLLALARYDEGTTAVDLAPADLIDIIFEQVSALKTRSGKTIDVSGVEPVIARVDVRLLEHALRNLLDNADRFAESTIAVSCTGDGDVFRIAVEDDGCGIAPEDRERVFGRFVRLSQSAESAKGSTGLGLAVVRSVAEAHGGRAFFEDSALGGARAVLELPLAD